MLNRYNVNCSPERESFSFLDQSLLTVLTLQLFNPIAAHHASERFRYVFTVLLLNNPL
jgi:hypothetical protein